MAQLPPFPELPAPLAGLLTRPGREWEPEARSLVAAWIQQHVLLVLVDRWVASTVRDGLARERCQEIGLEAADWFLAILNETLGPLDQYRPSPDAVGPEHFFEHLEKYFRVTAARTLAAREPRKPERRDIEEPSPAAPSPAAPSAAAPAAAPRKDSAEQFLVLEIVGPEGGGPKTAGPKLFGPEGGVIGRMAGSDWVLDDPEVSRQHARIRYSDGRFEIEDAGSRNGVFINNRGERLAPSEPYGLQNGDLIRIGPYRVRVTQDVEGARRRTVSRLLSLANPNAGVRYEQRRDPVSRRPGGPVLPESTPAPEPAPVEAGDGDPVEAGVFGPSTLARGHSRLIQVFVNRVGHGDEARAAALETDPAAKRLGFRSLAVRLRPGTELTFVLKAPKLQVEEAVLPLTWAGTTESVAFAVTVPEDCPLGMVIGSVSVAANSVPIGHITFQLEITDVLQVGGPGDVGPLTTNARRYRKAFISYASKDRNKVLARVQMLEPLGVEFFQDVMSLSPGDRWARQLYRHIDACDVFYLFWSANAKASEWVLKELQYAWALKRNVEDAPPAIQPVPIEGPPPVAPPAGFEWLHVDDPVLYFKVADQPDA